MFEGLSLKQIKKLFYGRWESNFKEKRWNWKKIETHLPKLPQKKTSTLPLIHQIPSRIVTILQPQPINVFLKI